jgi:hypothetical protein
MWNLVYQRLKTQRAAFVSGSVCQGLVLAWFCPDMGNGAGWGRAVGICLLVVIWAWFVSAWSKGWADDLRVFKEWGFPTRHGKVLFNWIMFWFTGCSFFVAAIVFGISQMGKQVQAGPFLLFLVGFGFIQFLLNQGAAVWLHKNVTS